MAHIVEWRVTYKVLVGNMREINHFSVVECGIILKCIFKRRVGMVEHGLNLSGWGQVAGSFECGNEPLDSIKCGELLPS